MVLSCASRNEKVSKLTILFCTFHSAATPSNFCCKPTLPLLIYMSTESGGELRIIQRIQAKYKLLSTLLLNDKDGTVTEAITIANFYQPDDITYAILSKWLSSSGRQPVTWATFIAVVKEVGLTELAQDIEKQMKLLQQDIHNPLPSTRNGMIHHIYP